MRGIAVVRCLVYLGLRSSEVINLNLDDVDWAAGTLCIAHGESRRADVLPLPEATGRANPEYLHAERPARTNRRIFARHVAPVDHPVGTDVVRNTVRAAYLRAGLAHTRVHILRPLMYCTLFGLIVAAGLRLSEALQLKVGDVDLDEATVTVRQTKFHKSRCLPIAASVVQALTQYRDCRDRHANPGATAPFFVSSNGGILPKRTVENVFERMRPSLQWQARGDHAHPRIHDMRHTFAVPRVQRWHEAGASIEHGMFWLCTYPGHAKISDTYWYLTGAPELMELVGSKFEYFTRAGERHK